MSKAVASKVYNEMNEEGMQAKTARVAVVCAVPLSDLKRETEFGRIVSEYFSTDLADHGVLVQELRLGKDIQILPQSGEFILSQNPGELANEALPIDYVVVSTFSNTKKNLILQGRMVSMQSGLIMTSWRYTMPLRDDLMSLLGASEPAFTIAVKGKE
jgi:TolB-like protein